MDGLLPILIPAISAALGAVVGAIAHPWGQDYVNRKSEERAEAQRVKEMDEARRARRKNEVRDRLLGIETAIAGVTGSGIAPTAAGAMTAYRGLRSVAADVGDPALVDAIGRMNSSIYGGSQWQAARGDASHRTGELLRELRDSTD